ncbi:hypothetical protein SKAU_G00420180 [Synaphobranchus kaupii]|uniref:Uncharacterized protein n=1 Tax=Synaphobranchus kaupii TaxID=118154 RepID=A0A9Q1IB19_SYNKA|nr:hypothetical protein SKAU_G00420180 [Synaphobranchus kaupii]
MVEGERYPGTQPGAPACGPGPGDSSPPQAQYSGKFSFRAHSSKSLSAERRIRARPPCATRPEIPKSSRGQEQRLKQTTVRNLTKQLEGPKHNASTSVVSFLSPQRQFSNPLHSRGGNSQSIHIHTP